MQWNPRRSTSKQGSTFEPPSRIAQKGRVRKVQNKMYEMYEMIEMADIGNR